MITHIIWDFNGTVLDDVNTAVAAVNCMLADRQLPPTDVTTYRNTLVMPLDKYYDTVGIHNADISTLSIEFRKRSEQNAHLSKISEGFTETVGWLKARGIINVLMSSLFQGYLSKEVEKYGIAEYFDYIEGMSDTAVGSKLEMAKKYLINNNIRCENVLFIGDLLSDAELAKSLGSECILIPNGHTSKERCLKAGVTVYDSIAEIKRYFKF